MGIRRSEPGRWPSFRHPTHHSPTWNQTRRRRHSVVRTLHCKKSRQTRGQDSTMTRPTSTFNRMMKKRTKLALLVVHLRPLLPGHVHDARSRLSREHLRRNTKRRGRESGDRWSDSFHRHVPPTATSVRVAHTTQAAEHALNFTHHTPQGDQRHRHRSDHRRCRRLRLHQARVWVRVFESHQQRQQHLRMAPP